MTDNTIDVDAVHDALIVRRRVNSINVMDAVFVRDGKVLEVTAERRNEWKFTGLHIIDFVDAHFTHKEPSE